MAIDGKYTISGISDPDKKLIYYYNENKTNMSSITDPNVIGTITDVNGEVKGNITPLIMIINSSGRGWRDAIRSLVRAGADPDMKINYYGRDTSAREIANKYRGGFPSVGEVSDMSFVRPDTDPDMDITNSNQGSPSPCIVGQPECGNQSD